MYSFLFAICLCGGFLGSFWSFFGVLEHGKTSISYLWIPALMVMISAFGGYTIVDTDPIRAVNGEGEIVTEYAKVSNVYANNIKLDNKNWKNTNEIISQKFPLELSGIKEGDIVRYDFISTDFGEYLIKIEKAE